LPQTTINSLVAEQATGATATLLMLMRSGVTAGGVSLTGSMAVDDWSLMMSTRAAAAPGPASDGRLFVYPTVYYPGTRSLTAAQSIVVASGEERGGVDLSLMLMPAGTIGGTLYGPEGPASGISLQLLPDYADQLNVDTLDVATTMTDGAGRFLMLGVPAGQYVLRSASAVAPVGAAAASASTNAGHWLMQSVTVTDSDSPRLSLTMRPGVTVRGRIEFDGASPKPGPDLIQKLFAGLEPLDPFTPRAQGAYQVNFDRSGQFVIPNVPPGRYAVRYAAFLSERQAMPGWETVGGMLGNKDLSSRPIMITADLDGVTIVLTDRPSELAGTVRSADGTVDPGAAVVLFTAERDLWGNMPGFTRRMRMVRASETGTFLIRGIPPGEYFVAAIPDEDAADWQDPRILNFLARDARRLAINYTEKKTQDLTPRAVR
jgi:hypothetical protein